MALLCWAGQQGHGWDWILLQHRHPSTPNPHTSARHVGTWPLSLCHCPPATVPLPLSPCPEQAPSKGPRAWLRCLSWAENRETGTGARLALTFLQSSFEAGLAGKYHFQPCTAKQSFPFPPGTSNFTPGLVGTNSVQTALAHSSTSLPLHSPDIWVWKQAGKHQHGFRLLCSTEENVGHWGAETN